MNRYRIESDLNRLLSWIYGFAKTHEKEIINNIHFKKKIYEYVPDNGDFMGIHEETGKKGDNTQDSLKKYFFKYFSNNTQSIQPGSGVNSGTDEMVFYETVFFNVMEYYYNPSREKDHLKFLFKILIKFFASHWFFIFNDPEYHHLKTISLMDKIREFRYGEVINDRFQVISVMTPDMYGEYFIPHTGFVLRLKNEYLMIDLYLYRSSHGEFLNSPYGGVIVTENLLLNERKMVLDYFYPVPVRIARRSENMIIRMNVKG